MIDLKQSTTLTIPYRPDRGQVILYVALSEAEDPITVLRQLQELGYQPELKYRSYPSKRIELIALLKYEQHEGEIPEGDYLGEEFEKLCTSGINPDLVHCQKCYRNQPVAA